MSDDVAEGIARQEANRLRGSLMELCIAATTMWNVLKPQGRHSDLAAKNIEAALATANRALLETASRAPLEIP